MKNIPVPEYNYPLATSTWDSDELDAMRQVIDSGNFTMGAQVRAFETQFASTFGVSQAVMSNSGSSANLLALAALKYSHFAPRPEKRDVIVPAISWSTTYFPVIQLGYRLKFVDVNLDTLNLTPESVSDAIDEHTAGVLAVNLLGNPCHLDSIRNICDSHGIFLMEDNCESMGAELDGRAAGSFGHIGTFSTFFSHHISTMEGGVSVTGDVELHQLMVSLRAHGWIRDLPFENLVWNKTGDEFEDSFKFVLPGYNLRPLELEGAIGIRQLSKLSDIVQGRRSNHKKFVSVMNEFPDMIIQKETGKSSWFGFSIVLSGKHHGRRPELLAKFREHGIATRPIVAGNFTRNPVMRHLDHVIHGELKNADWVHDNGLFIGNHHYAMEAEFEILREALSEFVADAHN